MKSDDSLEGLLRVHKGGDGSGRLKELARVLEDASGGVGKAHPNELEWASGWRATGEIIPGRCVTSRRAQMPSDLSRSCIELELDASWLTTSPITTPRSGAERTRIP